MADNEVPETIWMTPVGAELCKERNRYNTTEIPYVPATELARVRRETWDAAIKLAQDHVNKYSSYRCAEHIIEELTRARDESEGQG